MCDIILDISMIPDEISRHKYQSFVEQASIMI
jgi:hypothetical protein